VCQRQSQRMHLHPFVNSRATVLTNARHPHLVVTTSAPFRPSTTSALDPPQAVQGLQGCRVGIVFNEMPNGTAARNVRYQLRFEATPGGYRKDANNDITGVEQFLPGATWLTDKSFPLFSVLGPRSDIELYAPQTPDQYGNAPGYYKVGPRCTRWKIPAYPQSNHGRLRVCVVHACVFLWCVRMLCAVSCVVCACSLADCPSLALRYVSCALPVWVSHVAARSQHGNPWVGWSRHDCVPGTLRQPHAVPTVRCTAAIFIIDFCFKCLGSRHLKARFKLHSLCLGGRSATRSARPIFHPSFPPSRTHSLTHSLTQTALHLSSPAL